MRIHLLTAFCALLVSGCYYDNQEDLYPGAFCDTSNVTWTTTIQPLVLSNCANPGCHVPGGTGPGDFTQYSEVKAKVDAGTFRSQTLVTKVMPPGAPLTKCEQEQLTIWLDAGALEN